MSTQAPACIHCGQPLGTAGHQPPRSGYPDASTQLTVIAARPVSAVAAWAFGLSIAGAFLVVIAIWLSTASRSNTAAGYAIIVTAVLALLALVVAMGLGIATLKRFAVDSAFRGMTLAVLAVIFGGVGLLPLAAALVLTARSGFVPRPVAAGVALLAAALGYVVYRWARRP